MSTMPSLNASPSRVLPGDPCRPGRKQRATLSATIPTTSGVDTNLAMAALKEFAGQLRKAGLLSGEPVAARYRWAPAGRGGRDRLVVTVVLAEPRDLGALIGVGGGSAS